MGATVNIMLIPGRKNKENKRTIALRLTINRKRIYYSLGFVVKEEDWNKKTLKVSKNYDPKSYKEVNESIKYYNTKSLSVLGEIERSSKPITHELYKRKFFNLSSSTSVLEYYKTVIDDLKVKKKIGNAFNYEQSKNSFEKFVSNNGIKFEDIDVAFLNRWEKELSKTCSGNGISNYMRTLRALYNRAISEDLCSKEYYPFKTHFNNNGYDIGKLKTATIKRALGEEDLQKLKDYEPDDDYLIDAKNLFFFSFYTMGMNIIDICMLKWSNINNGRIGYIRSKNGKPHNIKILPPVLKILESYKEFDWETDYIFPVLKPENKTAEQIKEKVKFYNRTINRNLKRLGKLAEIANPEQLTTYVARHTWATTMKRKGVSTSIISEAMHHSDEKTTQIYLDSFENDIVDEMNEKLL